jgi:DNA modification methylase
MKWTTQKRKIDELIPYFANPRQMSDKQNKDLTTSLKKFDLVEIPAINKDGTILAGHQRLRIMQSLGRGDEEIDVRVPDKQLSENEVQEYNIRSNKNTGDWNFDELANSFEVDDLLEWGFDEKELKIDLPVEEDDVPEVQAEAVSKLGEIYQLGNHRLMCGDSTNKDDVFILTNFGKDKIDCVFTDPPYGMNAVSKSGVLSKNYKSDILGDDDNTIAIKSFELCRDYNILKQIWWGANYYSSILPDSECWLIWDKNNGESDQTDCELAWTNFRSVNRQFTQSSEKTNRTHPTQKPVSLVAWALKKFECGDNILDLFGGSGSTLIACEQLNRKCYMMELDPKYIDVIIKRWENLTGNKAEKL